MHINTNLIPLPTKPTVPVSIDESNTSTAKETSPLTADTFGNLRTIDDNGLAQRRLLENQLIESMNQDYRLNAASEGRYVGDRQGFEFK
jgi:hypothetical protein